MVFYCSEFWFDCTLFCQICVSSDCTLQIQKGLGCNGDHKIEQEKTRLLECKCVVKLGYACVRFASFRKILVDESQE